MKFLATITHERIWIDTTKGICLSLCHALGRLRYDGVAMVARLCQSIKEGIAKSTQDKKIKKIYFEGDLIQNTLIQEMMHRGGGTSR